MSQSNSNDKAIVPDVNKNVERPKVDQGALQQSIKEKQQQTQPNTTVKK